MMERLPNVNRQFSQSQKRSFYLLAFIFGIGFVSFFDYRNNNLFLIVLFILFFNFIIFRKSFLKILLICFIFFLLGIIRYEFSLPKNNPANIWYYNNQKVEFFGVVSAEPDIRIDHIKLTVQTKKISLKNEQKEISGKVLVKAGLYPKYQYGDYLKINCQIKAPEPIEDFKYDRYLAKDDIYSVCYRPKIKLEEINQGNLIMSLIYRQKNYWQEIINRNLPEPQAAIFSAMTLGARQGILPEINETFNITGTTHLIAISGFNISIIVTLLMEGAMLFNISRKKAFWLVTLSIIWYIIIIGFPASAVRAAFMGWLVILSRYVGRKLKLDQAILLSAFIMLFINPKILRDDASFQLSFLAILGLAYISPLFEKILKFLPEKFGFKESLQTTMAAQTSTMPLIAYSFGRVSLIAPVVNLLVIPAAIWLTIGGSATLILVLIFPFLEKFIFWPNYLLLLYLIKIIEFFAGLPGASLFL